PAPLLSAPLSLFPLSPPLLSSPLLSLLSSPLLSSLLLLHSISSLCSKSGALREREGERKKDNGKCRWEENRRRRAWGEVPSLSPSLPLSLSPSLCLPLSHSLSLSLSL